MSMRDIMAAQSIRKSAHKPKMAKPQRQVSGRDVYLKFTLVLGRANATRCDQRDVDELTEGPLAQLERLRTGKLDDDGFVEICEACSAAAELANELWKLGTPDTRAALESIKDELLAAGPVLTALGERDRYIPRGDELAALRRVFVYYADLIAIADRGAVCRALKEAAVCVKRKLREPRKALPANMLGAM